MKRIEKTASAWIKTTLSHQLLIATPAMDDDFFKKSVIYICEHSEEGAIGLVINHPISCSLQFIFEQMHIQIDEPAVKDWPVLIGGPVHQERGFVIHLNTEKSWHSSLIVKDNLCITTSHDILEAIAKGTGPKKILMVLGYAKWEKGQIEEELKGNHWLTCPVDPAVLFDVPLDKRWAAASALLGIDMNCFSTKVGHA